MIETPADSSAPQRSPRSSDAWRDWISDFVRHGPALTQTLRAGEEPIEALIRIYNDLSDSVQRELFALGLVDAFDGTQSIPQDARALFWLLHAIAYVKPASGKRLVRRRLYDETLSRITFAEQHLHTLTLQVAGRYDVDDDLVRYIQRSLLTGANYFRHLTVAFETLAWDHPTVAVTVIPQLLRHLDRDANLEELAVLLQELVLRWRYAHLTRWYRGAQRDPANFSKEGASAIMRVIQDRVAPWDREYLEPEGIVLAALAGIGNRRYSPADLRLMAQAAAAAGTSSAVDLLRTVWEASAHQWPDVSPWELVPLFDNALYHTASDGLNRCIISNDLGQITLDAPGDASLIIVFMSAMTDPSYPND